MTFFDENQITFYVFLSQLLYRQFVVILKEQRKFLNVSTECITVVP